MTTIIAVSSTAALYQALAQAKGGETISLAAGHYGKLALTDASGFAVDFPSNVTITSANPLHPARFSGLDLRNASNLTLDGVVCDYHFKAGDPLYTAPFSVNGGHDVTIRNCSFDGDVARGMSAQDNGFGTGIGLTIDGTRNVTVAGNEMSSFYRGLTMSDTTGAVISGNDVHDIRSDGMDFSQVHAVTIEGNHIHDFRTAADSGDHPDMIQFWTASTTEPSTDIVIRGNVLDMGNGTWTQTIFMGNEVVAQGLAGTSMYYRNVTIEDNVIVNGHAHGITVGEADGVTIQHNTVLHSDGTGIDGADGAVEIPGINVAPRSTHVVITGNVTGDVIGWDGQADWTVGQNAHVQDQDANAPGYYADVFITSSLTPQDGLHDFLARPGGLVDASGAGAAMTRDYLPAAGHVAAVFQMTPAEGGALHTRVFDASLSLSDKGALPAGAVCIWTFGDGTTAQGLKVTHDFATPGHYDVSLTIRLPGGAHDRVDGVIGIQNADILSLGSDGQFRATDYEDTILLPTGAAGSAAGLHLSSSGLVASIGCDHVAKILQTHDFDISMRLDAASRSSNGEIFRLHGGLLANMTPEGVLTVQATATDGSVVTLTSSATALRDLQPHDIDLRLHDGQMQLWVDGTLASQAAFAGTLNSFGPTDLTFGNPWGGQNFTGDLAGFDIRVGQAGPDVVKTLLSLGADGQFYGAAAAHSLVNSVAAPSPVSTTTGLILGGGGTEVAFAGGALKDLHSTRDFAVSLTLDADSPDSAGTLFRLPHGLASRVLSTGQIQVRAFGDAGPIRLVSETTPFGDGQAHDIDIRLQDGKLQLWIDNTLSAQHGFSGGIAGTSGHSMHFGSSNPESDFHGTLAAFDLSVAHDGLWSPIG